MRAGGSGFKVGRRASVAIGTPTAAGAPAVGAPAVGAPAVDAIAAMLRAKLGELKTCYANDTSDASPAKSVVVYRFTIMADGKPANPRASAPVISSALDVCVKRVLRTLSFAKPAGGELAVSVPLVFDSTGTLVMPARPQGLEADVWTPYAHASTPTLDAARGAVRVSEAAVRSRLAAIDRCFPGPSPTGSARLMLDIDVTGELGPVRVGGLGDAAVEACVAKALGGLHVMTPSPTAVEIACDLARGDAQPWRLAADAGYQVIEAERVKLRHGPTELVPGASDPAPLEPDTYLVLAQRDTPGALLQLALLWANEASVMFGVRDGAGAPLFLGMGHTLNTDIEESADTDAVRPALRVGGKTVTGCVSRGTHEAKLSEPAAIGALVQRLAARCRTLGCAPTLPVAIDSDAVARDLIEVTAAARRAGFDRVLLGGSELGCPVPQRSNPPAPRP